MPLLLLPLAVLAFVLLWLLLLPLGLVLRYRNGRARQRAVGWVLASNAWLLLVSALVFLASAWGSGHWVAQALPWSAAGMLAGLLLGVVGVWRTRFEITPAGFHYTPNRWLVLMLTVVVAVRIGLGMWQGISHIRGGADAGDWLAETGRLFTVGGLLLGYYLAYAWGLRRRWRMWQAERGG